MITEVTGKWKVPFIAAPTDGHFRCSTWIGLDGQRSYLDASLPQIGTARQVTQLGSSVTFKAYSWIQWYPRIDETIIPTLDFLPGQRAGAYMMVLPPAPLPFPPDTPGLPDPHWVFFYLTNLSVLTLSGYHPYAAFAWPVPECGWPDPEAPPFMQPEVAGGTAQWVMERPTVAGSDELRQFPIYNEVQFTDCYAKTAFKPGETGRPEEFTGPNLIRMHSDGRIRNQSVVVSRAERPLELGGLPNERYFRTSPPPV
jgi:hypothetical protein